MRNELGENKSDCPLLDGCSMCQVKSNLIYLTIKTPQRKQETKKPKNSIKTEFACVHIYKSYKLSHVLGRL